MITLLLSISLTLLAAPPSNLYSDTFIDHFSNPVELDWGDDAFLKYPGVKPAPEDSAESERFPYLSAVLYDAENPVAILDGRALEVGNSIYHRKVLQIGPNYVLLEKGNSVIEVMLGEKRKVYVKDKKSGEIKEEELSSKIGNQIKSTLLNGVGKLLK